MAEWCFFAICKYDQIRIIGLRGHLAVGLEQAMPNRLALNSQTNLLASEVSELTDTNCT